jgi:RNA polymerase sigma-70 factor (ECF subfamily)
MKLFQLGKRSPISSRASFGDMYECNRLPVFRYIYGLTGGPQEDVEDLVAATFLRAWQARHRFDKDIGSAIGWLIQIAKRLVIDEYRRSLQAPRILLVEHPVDPAPEQLAITGEQKNILRSLLAGLPVEQREMIVLRYMLGWRVNDIAQHMDMTENTISVNIHRTLSKLREKWIELDEKNMATVFTQEEKHSETRS